MTAIVEIERAARDFDHHAEMLRRQILDQLIADQLDDFPKEQVQQLAKHRFSHSEMRLLSYVKAAGSEVAYQRLTKDLDISQGMISRYVKRLAELGLLERYHKENDKKAVYLRLTSTGSIVADMHKQMHEKENEHYAAILAELPAEYIANAVEVLKKLSF
ncbi:MarR family winged helix-turn-helix transcriptional regulator [Limosilactobacillus mucosae]|uniref:MarR family winged helix-turn-helix transcriptional regulator n=1 Tax=Limosilactobacillus mucosae TaxID=97478 RepID=UPI003994A55F